MTSRLKRQWAALQRARPGRRFEERYEAAQRKENRASFLARVVRFTIATAALAVGVVLVFIPGPAVLFFAIAGALLASESRGVARFLDWSEVKIRAVLRWAQRTWKRLPMVGKVAVAIMGAAGGAGAGVVGYRVITG